jgi:hypothetical protein
MSPPNHLHLDPFLSSYPLSPTIAPLSCLLPPNYQHELIVASDGWRSACKLPVSHHHPIIVVVEASVVSCHLSSAAPCRRRAARRRCRAASSCHVVVPPVTVVGMLPLAVVVPRRRAARRRRRVACRPAAPCHRCVARRCRRATSSCRPSPFVFLGCQSEELDLTKAQWRRP